MKTLLLQSCICSNKCALFVATSVHFAAIKFFRNNSGILAAAANDRLRPSELERALVLCKKARNNPKTVYKIRKEKEKTGDFIILADISDLPLSY